MSRSISLVTAANDLEVFCRAVEARSQEHRKVLDVAVAHGWWAIASTVLRMELDSMIRVIYLVRTPDERDHILASCVGGRGFKNVRGRVRDLTMLYIAKTADYGWIQAVYDFGNKFVHLTDAHDYAEVDPFPVYENRAEVIDYLNYYHRGKVHDRPLEDGSTLGDIAAYAPYVLEKIATNLRMHIEELRAAVAGNG